MKRQTIKPLKDNLKKKLYELTIRKDLFTRTLKALIVKTILISLITLQYRPSVNKKATQKN